MPTCSAGILAGSLTDLLRSVSTPPKPIVILRSVLSDEESQRTHRRKDHPSSSQGKNVIPNLPAAGRRSPRSEQSLFQFSRNNAEHRRVTSSSAYVSAAHQSIANCSSAVPSLHTSSGPLPSVISLRARLRRGTPMCRYSPRSAALPDRKIMSPESVSPPVALLPHAPPATPPQTHLRHSAPPYRLPGSVPAKYPLPGKVRGCPPNARTYH